MSNASDFIIEDGVLKKYKGKGGDVVIPDGVTSIGESAFNDCLSLTGITIPDSVTSIGDYAFNCCRSLTSITIPDGVTSIGDYAFNGCGSLTSVTIPDGVTSIGDYAFNGCWRLTSVIIPEGVTSIGNSVFYDCSSLKSITIPEGVTGIGESAFHGCRSLTSITIPDGVTSIGDGAFSCCSSLTGIVIPDSVTSIDNRAFNRCSSLTSITIPDSVTSIGDYAFNGCSSLTSVTIPDSVTSIGDWAFSGCSSLTGIAIPGSIAIIGSGAFSGCKGLAAANGFAIIRDVLYGYIGSDDKVIIPDRVRSIGGGAFSGCSSLKRVIIPDSVTSIGDYAFNVCSSLKSITIPNSVTSIGSSAFDRCSSLKSITIPNSVTSIGNRAFSGCSSLKSIILPDSVTSIGDLAFYDCSSLTGVTIPEGVMGIGKRAFSGCSSLTSVIIPDGVTSIGDLAFWGCSSLTSITIPEGVTGIGERAFEGCSSLTSITIPDSVTSIGDGAFNRCSSLTSVIIPDGVTSIGDWVFWGCSKLAISIPENLFWKNVNISDNIGIVLRNGDERTFIGCCSKGNHCGNSIDEVLKNKKWEIYDVGLAGADKTYSYKTPARIMGILGRMDNPVDMDEKVRDVLTAFLVKNSKKALKIAQDLRCPEIIRTMLRCGILDEEQEKAFRKLLAQSSVPEIAELSQWQAEGGKRTLQKAVTEEKVISEADKLVIEILQNEGKPVKDMNSSLEQFYGVNALELSLLPKVHGNDGIELSTMVLAYLLTEHEAYDGKTRQLITSYKQPGVSENASKILHLIKMDEFEKFLGMLAEKNLGLIGNTKKMYLAYPICRYADDETMNELLKRAPKWRSSVSGNDAPPLYTFRKACLYSECRAVIVFADKYGDLDEYARIRGTDAQTIRDTVLADFGFDTAGKKQYDLGGTTIVVTLEKDCLLSLFDTKNNKAVKSIPKRGNDEALVAAAAKDFADLKKNVKKVLKNRFAQLFSDFLKGTKQSAENWGKAYIGNPLLRTVANIVVWQQGKKTFILQDNKAIGADGAPYTIGKMPIQVAHPMEMTQKDLSAWQSYFLNHSLKQPFEQIWEPVIRPEEVREDRYAGVSIPYFRFLKQEKHGIFVDDLGFHAEIIISFKECDADVERLDGSRHDISPDDCFEVRKFRFKKYSRQVNHIVAYLDRASIYNRIVNDDVTVAQYLQNLTLAQVSKFIEAASQNNCPNVSAILLEYKNEHFADLDPMAEFTLEDW